MQKLVEASLILSLSIVCTALVLSLVLPSHPLAAEAPAAAPGVQLAVFVEGMDSRIIPASAQDACPFLAEAAAPSACPYLRQSAGSRECPFLAQRGDAGSCPLMKGSSDGSSCPYSGGTLPGEGAPSTTCPRRDDRRPAVPEGGDLRLAPPLTASLFVAPVDDPLSS